MRSLNTAFTIAEYCSQMDAGTITVNREYQRSPHAWPPAARSYLIDTILHDYPIPKISLYQKVDLRSKKTLKEIVDGQQRSMTIHDFYNDKLRLLGNSDYEGLLFSELEEKEKKAFREYCLTTDLFVDASESAIREMFRRINSYTVPLNPEEQRHATHQGAFKWFVLDLIEQYSSALKNIGVFTERGLSRMQDAKLVTEIILAWTNGIETYTKKKLDSIYKEHDDDVSLEERCRWAIDKVMEKILIWEDIHNSAWMKPYNFYSLFLAVSHIQKPWRKLEMVFPRDRRRIRSDQVVTANLGILERELERDVPRKPYKTFVKACSEATNTKANREERFRTFCKCLTEESLE